MNGGKHALVEFYAPWSVLHLPQYIACCWENLDSLADMGEHPHACSAAVVHSEPKLFTGKASMVQVVRGGWFIEELALHVAGVGTAST